jgi:hypothetical protein
MRLVSESTRAAAHAQSGALGKTARATHAQFVRMPTVLCVVSAYVEFTPREIQPPSVLVGSCISSTMGTDSLAGQSGNAACTALPLSAMFRLRYAQHCGRGCTVSLARATNPPPLHTHLVVLRHLGVAEAIRWRVGNEDPESTNHTRRVSPAGLMAHAHCVTRLTDR